VNRGVLVEFGCQRGDSIVAGNGAERSQTGGNRLRYLDAQPDALIVDPGGKTRQPQVVRGLRASGKTIDR
jgi:hypothetical protein